jgi:S-adenosylmethionine hydrolase
MDLRAYYKKLREVEGQLPNPFVVMVSIETPDGGKAGVLTEVPRRTAAKQIVEDRARIASAEESETFHLRNQEARQAAEQALAVSKMQFVVVPAKINSKGPKE